MKNLFVVLILISCSLSWFGISARTNLSFGIRVITSKYNGSIYCGVYGDTKQTICMELRFGDGIVRTSRSLP